MITNGYVWYDGYGLAFYRFIFEYLSFKALNLVLGSKLRYSLCKGYFWGKKKPISEDILIL